MAKVELTPEIKRLVDQDPKGALEVAKQRVGMRIKDARSGRVTPDHAVTARHNLVAIREHVKGTNGSK